MRGRKVPPQIEAEVCRLYTDERMSTGQIATRVGLTRMTVGAVLKRNGVPLDLSRRGFALVDVDQQREIAREGGKAVPPEKRTFTRDRKTASRAGRKSTRRFPEEQGEG